MPNEREQDLLNNVLYSRMFFRNNFKDNPVARDADWMKPAMEQADRLVASGVLHETADGLYIVLSRRNFWTFIRSNIMGSDCDPLIYPGVVVAFVLSYFLHQWGVPVILNILIFMACAALCYFAVRFVLVLRRFQALREDR